MCVALEQKCGVNKKGDNSRGKTECFVNFNYCWHVDSKGLGLVIWFNGKSILYGYLKPNPVLFVSEQL